MNIGHEIVNISCDYDVHIVAGKEMGSTMLGTRHEDSDHDVMVLFSQNGWQYAAPDGYLDTIDTDRGSVDFHGWNVKKFADLLGSSNPMAVEFLLCDEWRFRGMHRDKLASLSNMVSEQFTQMKLYHSYRYMAEDNYTDGLETENQFYALLYATKARYVAEIDELPPVNVYDLAEAAYPEVLDDHWHDQLVGLADRKALGKGDQENPDVVGEYVDQLEEEVDLSTERRPDEDQINHFLKAVIQ